MKTIFAEDDRIFHIFTDGNKDCHRTLDGTILLP